VTATSFPDERALRAAWRTRRRAATAALVLGIVATVLPAGVTDGAYLQRWWNYPGGAIEDSVLERHDLSDLVGRDGAWTAVVTSLVVLPLWFWFWRRSAMSGARTLGVVASLAVAAGVFSLAEFVAGGSLAFIADGLFWLHVAAALCFAAAFALAPPPRAAL
jgi:hypothetical protein